MSCSSCSNFEVGNNGWDYSPRSGYVNIVGQSAAGTPGAQRVAGDISHRHFLGDSIDFSPYTISPVSASAHGRNYGAGDNQGPYGETVYYTLRKHEGPEGNTVFGAVGVTQREALGNSGRLIDTRG